MEIDRTQNLIKIVVALVLILMFYAIISDWANFKAGLLGKAPVY